RTRAAGYRTSGWPPNRWRIFGRPDRMRLPSPAARTTAQVSRSAEPRRDRRAATGLDTHGHRPPGGTAVADEAREDAAELLGMVPCRLGWARHVRLRQ